MPKINLKILLHLLRFTFYDIGNCNCCLATVKTQQQQQQLQQQQLQQEAATAAAASEQKQLELSRRMKQKYAWKKSIQSHVLEKITFH